MNKAHYIGLMSGTSVDAIDAALVAVDQTQLSLIDFTSTPLNSALQQALIQLNHQPHIALDTLCTLHAQLGHAFAQAAQQLIERHPYLDIKAIGSHGQTIFHAPSVGMSLQIGHPAIIAKLTGLPTIADFRIDDMALGGQGAPLAPAFHQTLFPQLTRPHVIINIGGIANISLIASQHVIGYDTGPGNGLMNEVCRQHLNCDYDNHGALAAQNPVDNALLQRLLGDSYFRQPAPKSTGRDYFNQAWLTAYLTTEISPLTLLSTLNQLTVETLAQSLESHNLPVNTPCIICGGGAYNLTLIQRLQTRLPQLRIQTSVDYAIDPNAIEAMMCAWLAQQRFTQQAIDLTLITGAQRPAMLGGLWLP